MNDIAPKKNKDLQQVEKKQKRKKKIPIIISVAVVAVLVIAGVVWFALANRAGDDTGGPFTGGASGGVEEVVTSPLSGLPIDPDRAGERPYAVMYGADTIARPHSGIGQAEIVFEMPAGGGFLTRMMGVFLIEQPEEVGSIRSARHDFIPLARYLDAVLVHWGGSYRAYSHLKAGYIEDLDALTDGAYFYRVNRAAAPYNGFTSNDLVRQGIAEMGFSDKGTFDGYDFVDDGDEGERPESDSSLKIPYPGAYAVEFKYNKPENKYIRYQGGQIVTDRNTGEEVTVKNVVVMYSPWQRLQAGAQYLEVDVETSGECEFYKNGAKIPCTWEKGKLEDKLTFRDESGEEIEFVTGHTFVEIISPNDRATWTPIAVEPDPAVNTETTEQ